MGLGGEHAVDLVEAVGDDVGDLLVLAHTYQGDEVDLPGDGIDLGHARQLGDLLGHLRDPVDCRLDEHDRGDHAATLAIPGHDSTHSPSSTARRTARLRTSTTDAYDVDQRRSSCATSCGSAAVAAWNPSIGA